MEMPVFDREGGKGNILLAVAAWLPVCGLIGWIHNPQTETSGLDDLN